MKKSLFLLLFIQTLFLATAQSNSEYILFVFGKEECLEGRPTTDIDSITFGVNEEGKLTQIIHSRDAQILTPVTDIDEVRFETPKVQINKDVFQLTHTHDAYLRDATTASFTLSIDTPSTMLPSKGNIVVATVDCESFEDGIVARVVSVSKDASGYHYACEPASYSEVYDTLIYAANGTPESEQTRAVESEIDIFNRTWSASASLNNLKLSYTLNLSSKLRFYAYRADNSPMTVGLEIENSSNATTSFSASFLGRRAVNVVDGIRFGRITLPHPLLSMIWLTPTLSANLFVDIQDNISLQATRELEHRNTYFFRWHGSDLRMWRTTQRGTGPFALNNYINHDLSIDVGQEINLLLGINGSRTGIGASISQGGYAHIEGLPLDFNYTSDNAYDELQSLTTSIGWFLATSLFGQTGLFASTDQTNLIRIELSRFEVPLYQTHWVPTFHNGQLQQFGTAANVSYVVQGNVLRPIEIGTGIYNQSNDLLHRYENGDTYSSTANNREYSWKIASDFISDENKVYPIVNINGNTVRAKPAVSFKKCPVQFKSVTVANAYYDADTDNNYMVLDVTVTGTSNPNIIEYGVCRGTTYLQFEKGKQTQSCRIFGKTKTLKDSGELDFKKKVFKTQPNIKCYAVIKNNTTAQLDTLYSNPYTDFITYNKKPSIKFSNFKLLRHEVESESYNEDTGETTTWMRTYYSYDRTTTGTIWMRTGEWILTRGWSRYPNPDDKYISLSGIGDNTNNYNPFCHYTRGSNNLEFSQWIDITCRETNEIISSNAFNFYDDGELIAGCSFSDRPIFYASALNKPLIDTRFAVSIHKLMEEQYSKYNDLPSFPIIHGDH